jgi:hypothetical protein
MFGVSVGDPKKGRLYVCGVSAEGLKKGRFVCRVSSKRF